MSNSIGVYLACVSPTKVPLLAFEKVVFILNKPQEKMPAIEAWVHLRYRTDLEITGCNDHKNQPILVIFQGFNACIKIPN